MPNLIELTSSPGSTILHIEEILAQIKKEYSETEDQVQRNSLLDLHHASLDLVQATIRPDDLERFLESRAQHYWALLAFEATDEEGNIDAEELEQVTAREIAAGRMESDDKLRALALQGAEAARFARAGDFESHGARNKTSLWRRFLGAFGG